MGATQANDFLRQADGYGQARGHHPNPRTDPDEAERLTGIYGSDAHHCSSEALIGLEVGQHNRGILPLTYT